jgi:histidinol-phosphate aminotransferase
MHGQPNFESCQTMTKRQEPAEAWLRPEILALSAYHVQPSKGYIKLDAMENPYPWPEDFVSEWVARLKQVEPNRYPDPGCEGLRRRLYALGEIPPTEEILFGNGSDEIIQLILMALKPGSTVMAPEPTFVMYRQIARSLGLEFVGVPLVADDFSLDLAAMLSAIETQQPAVVFLAYPNNPTGNAFERAGIEAIIQASKGLVVVDEAYAAYANDSFMQDLGHYPNLVVMRTLSKLGLAGLRLGYLAGPKPWVEAFEKIRLPYNINVLTQVSAECALDHPEVFKAQVALIRSERSKLMLALQSLSGLKVYSSDTNFILFRVEHVAAQSVFEALKASGILIKNLSASPEPLKNTLRVTVGTSEENAAFLSALRKALA